MSQWLLRCCHRQARTELLCTATHVYSPELTLPPLLQFLHEAELEGVREELMPRVDANLRRELAAFRRLCVEDKYRGAVRVVFAVRRKHHAPYALARASAVRRQRRNLVFALRQAPVRHKLHAHVRRLQTIEHRRNAQ